MPCSASREGAEKAKIELSSMVTTQISIPFIATGKQGPVHLEQTLSRTKFNELTDHLVRQTMEPVKAALADSNLSVQQISKVLMVGGSSRIPCGAARQSKISWERTIPRNQSG